MADQEQPEQPKPFPHADPWFYVIGTIVALPLGKSGWDALMAGERLLGVACIAIALVTAITIYSFQYWESHLEAPTRRVLRDLVSNRMIVAGALVLFLAYGFFVVPDLLKPQVNPTVEHKVAWQPERLGRLAWLNLRNSVRDSPDEIHAAPNRFYVMISAADAVIGYDLVSLFRANFAQSNITLLVPPDYDRDFEPPKVALGGPPGITIYGRNPVAEFIEQVLQGCYVLHPRIGDLPAGVAEFYHRKYPTTVALSDGFVWLKVDGSLLLKPSCSDLPGN